MGVLMALTTACVYMYVCCVYWFVTMVTIQNILKRGLLISFPLFVCPDSLVGIYMRQFPF